jgi:hypothetical protein
MIDSLRAEVGKIRRHARSCLRCLSRTATAGPPDGEPRRPQRRDIVSHRGGGARPSRTSPFGSAGITAVLLLHEGVPELAAEPASLHCSPSPTSTGRRQGDPRRGPLGVYRLHHRRAHNLFDGMSQWPPRSCLRHFPRLQTSTASTPTTPMLRWCPWL